jgi:hypothetical protein
VLFDSGASHSFVTENFVEKGKLESTMMPRTMLVQIPGSVMKTKRYCIDVPVVIHGASFQANLIILGTKGLDVVLGMDFFFERKCGRGSPYSDFVFLKIRTQIRVYGDLNLGGWVVHPLP